MIYICYLQEDTGLESVRTHTVVECRYFGTLNSFSSKCEQRLPPTNLQWSIQWFMLWSLPISLSFASTPVEHSKMHATL